jgi:hypothetical protein
LINDIATVRVRATLLVVLAVCTACGGGGGSPPTSPPPPPPSGVSISAIATAMPTTVDEGQPFKLDASASTISSGATLTYAWTQVSGPSAVIVNPATAAQDLSAPEVTANSTAQFRVTVSSGASSASTTVNVNINNIAQTPAYGSGPQLLATATFSVPVRKIVGDFNFGLAGVANQPSDPLTFLDFSISSNQLQVAPSQLASLPSSAIMRKSSLYVPSGPNNPNPAGSPQFSVIEESANRFRIFVRSFSNTTIATGADFSLTQPCAFSHGTVRSSSALYVGQKAGFTTIDSGGSAPVIDRTIIAGKPFCALLAQRTPISGTVAAYNNVLALDTDANVFNVFEPDSLAGNANYLLTKQVAAQLNASKPLTLAAWTEIDPFGGMGNPTAMALVFTDGTHNGEHRLVIASLDTARNVVQQTYSLGLGVPIEVFTDNLDADSNFPEIVIVKSSSPQAEIFEPTGSGNISAFSGPQYLEIGLGASSAVRSGMLSLQGISVAFPDKRQVRVIGVTP